MSAVTRVFDALWCDPESSQASSLDVLDSGLASLIRAGMTLLVSQSPPSAGKKQVSLPE
jgi:hypothetical protein